MIDKLIQRSFALRNAAHGAHWKTKSYSEHEALGSFYDDLVDKLDRYVEVYQGMFGIVKADTPDQVKDIKLALNREMLWLSENRAELAREVPALENIIDELTATYARTLYKLENLR